MPRLEIDLSKIHHNTRTLVDRLASKGIAVTGVTKAALGDPEIARAMLQAGVDSIGDSRIENIQRMREAGVAAKFILLRTPLMSQVEQVVQYADISFNTEPSIVESLGRMAVGKHKLHQVVLMVELGDLREGILPQDLENVVRRVLQYPGIQLIGLGTNLACYGGVKPDIEKMTQISDLAKLIESRFDLPLPLVSGGNSANFEWFSRCPKVGAINNLRLGESIFLGRETLERQPIEGLHTDAVTLVAEVIESKIKPSLPYGEQCQTAFGARPIFQDRGAIRRAILGIGRQDVDISGLAFVTEGMEVLGGSSDHLIIDCQRRPLHVGDEVKFRPNYAAMLAAMTSPHVAKVLHWTPESDEESFPACPQTDISPPSHSAGLGSWPLN